jgi:hypothetical protein
MDDAGLEEFALRSLEFEPADVGHGDRVPSIASAPAEERDGYEERSELHDEKASVGRAVEADAEQVEIGVHRRLQVDGGGDVPLAAQPVLGARQVQAHLVGRRARQRNKTVTRQRRPCYDNVR